MNLEELKEKLFDSNVPEQWYSLDEGLKFDSFILYQNYSKWEFFYLDEKGERLDYKIFGNDDDAYDYLWKKIERDLKVFNILPREK